MVLWFYFAHALISFIACNQLMALRPWEAKNSSVSHKIFCTNNYTDIFQFSFYGVLLFPRSQVLGYAGKWLQQTN
jgi:hypothetical protein